jgi:DNA polymerase III delta prime subunit
MNSNTENIPWTEKYRPNKFDDIVLDPTNKKIFLTMLKNKYFPNLLLYGPPGTGKTTTVINLINEYQKSQNHINKSLVIHLNASDERGIDTIRNQIYQFAKTKNLFETGYKFVVLDEVDYMTKNAQQALKYLLQVCSENVKFCLICNYISKIELSLQHEFICVRFNQLPSSKIHEFIRDICVKENLDLCDKSISVIQNLYKSDIRSMINFIQLNQNLVVKQDNIINASVWERLDKMFNYSNHQTSDYLVLHNMLKEFIHKLSIHYNIDKKQIIKDYYSYCIRTADTLTADTLSRMEVVLHNYDCKIDALVDYFIMDNIRGQ